MRITGGVARGTRIHPPRGHSIRPTSDRVREALFQLIVNILGTLKGAKVLDLFAGAGTLGIEAISRGARSCVFVDKSASSLALIQKNLNSLNISCDSYLLKRDIRRISSHKGLLKFAPFDLILADPPYRCSLSFTALELIANNRLLHPDGLLVIEEDKRVDLQERISGDDLGETLVRQQIRRYGDTSLHFYGVLKSS